MFGIRPLTLTENQNDILRKYVKEAEFDSYYHGIETRPLEYEFMQHCVVPKVRSDGKGNRINRQELVIDGIQISRPYQANFVLNHQKYIYPGFSISHVCGRAGCMESSHMLIESLAINTERRTCHGIIDDWVQDQQRDGVPKADRTGTIWILEEDCPHSPTCFKQFGRFTVL